MKDVVIRSLSLMGNYMQSEGELRFSISLYEIFIKLDLESQSRNTIHKRKNGEKLETLIRIKSYFIVRNYVEN